MSPDRRSCDAGAEGNPCIDNPLDRRLIALERAPAARGVVIRVYHTQAEAIPPLACGSFASSRVFPARVGCAEAATTRRSAWIHDGNWLTQSYVVTMAAGMRTMREAVREAIAEHHRWTGWMGPVLLAEPG